MLKRTRNKQGPEDLNESAFRVVSEATDEERPAKNPAAVALGRLGGKIGGKARAEKLSAEKRSEIARLAAQKRWGGRNSA